MVLALPVHVTTAAIELPVAHIMADVITVVALDLALLRLLTLFRAVLADVPHVAAIAALWDHVVTDVAGFAKTSRIFLLGGWPASSKLGTRGLVGELKGDDIFHAFLALKIDNRHGIGDRLFLGDEMSVHACIAKLFLHIGKGEVGHRAGIDVQSLKRRSVKLNSRCELK